MKLEILNMILTIFNIFCLAIYPFYFRLMCSIMTNQLSEHENFTQTGVLSKEGDDLNEY